MEDKGAITSFCFAPLLMVLVLVFARVEALDYTGPVIGKVPRPLYEADATSAPATSLYDYIIVGGGATACTLAATLAASKRVLVLERGGVQEEYQGTTTVTGFGISSPALERFRSVDGSWLARGLALGGGTTVSTGVLADAGPDFLQALGLNPTKAREAFAYVHRLGTFANSNNTFYSGPWLNALRSNGFSPIMGKVFNSSVGIREDATQFDRLGVRHTAAEFVRQPGLKLVIYLRAVVRKIQFSSIGPNRTATGVIFTDRVGGIHTALGKVILSAGVIGSTQLLMLNGIGPQEQLRRLGITPYVNLPVGEGVQDSPSWQSILPSPIPTPNAWLNQNRYHGITYFTDFTLGAGYPLISGAIVTGQLSVLPASSRTQQLLDLIVGNLFQQDLLQPGFIEKLNQALVLVATLSKPLSRGYINLTSTIVEETPGVLLNYLSHPLDASRAADALRRLQRLVQGPQLGKFQSRTLSAAWKVVVTAIGIFNPGLLFMNNFNGTIPPFPASSLQTPYVKLARGSYVSAFHLSGGNHVGRVVDGGFRVRQVRNLWVVDASVFPYSPGTNPINTCLMLGRYVGLQLLASEK